VIAKVILNSTSHATDAVYDYLVPQEFNVSVGMRVMVPFGRGNKPMEAYVVSINENSEYKSLKSIYKIVDEFSYFDNKGVEIAEFMRHRYFCRYAEAIKTLLPPNVNTKFKTIFSLLDFQSDEAQNIISHSVVYERIIDFLKNNGNSTFEQITEFIKGKNIKNALTELKKIGIIAEHILDKQNIKDTEKDVLKTAIDKEELYLICDNIRKRAPKQAAVLETVCDNDGIYLSEVLEICNTDRTVVNALIKKGYIYIEKEVVRTDIIDSSEYPDSDEIVLTDEQKHVIKQISADIDKKEYSTCLLHGVTGSGKTEVYLNLVDTCIKNGKNAIFLVPEISLTPQMIRQVVTRFGENVAVLHSSLTIRERYDQWKKIKCGEVNVVVGARSAVFAPFDNIGLIIIDEEHESSYKSELSPKYSTVEIARLRAKQHNATLLLASATPSVETYFLAKTNKFKLIELKNRINSASLPEINIVDMRTELKNGNTSILSNELMQSISYNLEKGFKTILFLNRRGYSGFIQCRSCGYVMECPNCNISMTYHRHTSSLVCHYCDYKSSLISICPKCGGNHIKFSGDGTQKVEDEICAAFPDAKVLRMDADTTASRNSHEQILNEFAKDESDILVGTQMITKGLDFEKVTLVGVLSADMSLNIDDFRSDEKTFDLITQVCGRSGRGKYPGRAIIQTYDPENETIQFSKEQDYIKFYNREIEVRKLLTYPPFCEIINFVFSSENDYDTKNSALKFHSMLKEKLSGGDYLKYVVAYKVIPSPIYKINGKYRYRFIMKLTYSKKIFDMIHEVAEGYRKLKNCANLIIDANPYNMY